MADPAGTVAPLVDELRRLILLHPAFSAAENDGQAIAGDDTLEMPYASYVARTLYVFEADDSDERAPTGPNLDENTLELIVVYTRYTEGEEGSLTPDRAVSLDLDRKRAAILEVIRRNRSKYGPVPDAALAGQATPWSHLWGRADVRFSRQIRTRAVAVRVFAWRTISDA